MYAQAWQRIQEAKHILIASHIYPDGDALGSSLGFYNVLKNMDKKVSLYNATQDAIPKNFDFLKGFSKVTSRLPKFYDLVVAFDCGSFERLGLGKSKDVFVINIDHHKSNTLYGDINIVDKDASSAGIVTYRFLQEVKAKVNKDTAEALYTAIAEDTGFFSYGSLDAGTFDAAASLIRLGAEPKEISKAVRSRESLAKMRLLAFMYGNFELHCDGEVVSIIFDEKLMAQTGANRTDTKNIVSLLRDMVNVRIAVMVLQDKDKCKVSLRGDGSQDLSSVALSFGRGGGHESAAGFDVITDNPEQLCKQVIERIKSL